MNIESLEILRSVLKEELEPINKRLGGFERNFDTFTKEKNENFDTITKVVNENFATLTKEIIELKTGQERLQKNIIESLGQFTEKIADHVDNKTSALNKRVFAVETEIQRLTRQ